MGVPQNNLNWEQMAQISAAWLGPTLSSGPGHSWGPSGQGDEGCTLETAVGSTVCWLSMGVWGAEERLVYSTVGCWALQLILCVGSFQMVLSRSQKFTCIDVQPPGPKKCSTGIPQPTLGVLRSL